MPYRAYAEVLVRRWWILPMVALVAAVTALAFVRFQSPVYRSSSRLLVTPGRPDLSQQLTLEKQLRPMAQKVKTTEIAREVDRVGRLDLGPERLLAKIRTEAIVDQGYVQIDAEDSDPERAERIAGMFAQVFAQQQAAADVGKPLAERLNVDVLDRPGAAAQIWPQPRILVPVVALIGLLAGVFLAFGLEYLDNTVKTADEVEQLLGLAALAVIPRDQAAGRPPRVTHAPVAPRGEQRVS